jgi:hypothetical protein
VKGSRLAALGGGMRRRPRTGRERRPEPAFARRSSRGRRRGLRPVQARGSPPQRERVESCNELRGWEEAHDSWGGAGWRPAGDVGLRSVDASRERVIRGG